MRLPPPKTARGAVRQFRLLFWIALPVSLAVIAWLLYAVMRSSILFHKLPHGNVVAAVLAFSVFASVLATAYQHLGSYRPYRWLRRTTASVFAVTAGMIVYDFFANNVGAPQAIALVPAAMCGIPGFYWVSASINQYSSTSLSHLSRAPRDARQADRMARECEALLASGKLDREQRMAVEINLSRALIRRSFLDDEPDGLVVAADMLRALLADPPQKKYWYMVLNMAQEYVNAMQLKAVKHGDLSGYSEALDILVATADRMPPDAGAAAFAYDQIAEHHKIISDRISTGEQWASHIDAAIAALRSAIAAVTPPSRKLLPVLYAKLGELVAARHGDPAEVDEGIALCREGQRLAGRSRHARAMPELALASLLWARAGLTDEADARVKTDLGEAERLLQDLITRGPTALRWEARVHLARVRSAWSWVLSTPDAQATAAAAWREAAHHAIDISVTAMMQFATNWVGWATSTEHPQSCADAYQYLMSVVPRAAANRYLAQEKERLLAEVESGAEESGYWMSRVGRVRDAAVALELGRAVTISEVLSRDLPTVLSRVGRHDLLARHQHAVWMLGQAQQTGGTPLAQRAWAEFQSVSREVAAIDGTHQVVAPVVYQDIVAAAVHGPLVYLAAAQRTGYAVIITGRHDPVWLPLPNLSREKVRAQTAGWLASPDQQPVTEVIRWLWENGIGELAAHLPAGVCVTLVPAGVLSLLPIHAAGGPRDPSDAPAHWHYLSDRVTVRYTPNARTLVHAFRRAAHCERGPLTLLAVDAPDADLYRPLPHTRQETSAIAHLWRSLNRWSSHIPNATRNGVLDALNHHLVWHFACHCDATPYQVLGSALLFNEGRLTLADLLSVPASPRRLAVLSACRTHTSSHELPNEVIGLPGGMLQVGLAGVIASHWSVNDQSTALLMTRFYQEWRSHRPCPAEALAAAQRWLRQATQQELHAQLRDPNRDLSPPSPADPNQPHPFDHPHYWAPFALTGA